MSRLAYSRPIDISSWTFQPMMGGQSTSKRGLDKAIEATPGRRRPRDAKGCQRQTCHRGGHDMPCVMTEIGRHQPLRSGNGSCEADAFGIVLPNLWLFFLQIVHLNHGRQIFGGNHNDMWGRGMHNMFFVFGKSLVLSHFRVT